MKISLITAGSHGDTRPFVALGRGLVAAGHDVILGTPTDQQAFVEENDVPWASLGLDFKAMSESETVRKATSGSPSAMIKAFRESQKSMGILIEKAGETALSADVIVYHPKTFVGSHIYEARGTTVYLAMPLPGMMPTREFPVPLASMPNWKWFNKSTYMANRSGMAPFRKLINQWRNDTLGLGKIGLFDDPYKVNGSYLPMLYAYSPAVVPPASDWPDTVCTTGYWLLDGVADSFEPPEALVKFLDAGEPPVYIGFGSLTGTDPEKTTRNVFQAVKNAGVRAVLATGWGGLTAAESGQNIYMIESVPHNWLFPRCSAVVHHGGSGTTATGLKAGRPTVICPFFGDQPFWGQRVFELGVGPKPIAQKKLSAENLTEAIKIAVTDQSIRDAAEKLGLTLKKEDGVAKAISVIENGIGTCL